MRNYKKKVITAFLLLCTSPVLADGFSATTEKPVGESLTLALNAGVRARIVWDDSEDKFQDLFFTGDFMELPVLGKKMEVQTEQPVTQLFCAGNRLSQLRVSGLKNLETLVCCDNQLAMLSLQENTCLKEVLCQRNQLGALTLRSEGLERLDVAQNPLHALNLVKAPALSYVNISQTGLSRFDTSVAPGLKTLVAYEGRLSALDLPESVQVVCAPRHNLSALDLSRHGSLRLLWVSDNKLKELDLKQAGQIEDLMAERNELEQISFSFNARNALRYFYVAENALAYNSFPTPSEDCTLSLQPQRPLDLKEALQVGETLQLNSFLSRNAWGSGVSAEVIWKDQECQSLLDPACYENPKGYSFIFKEPVGNIYAEATSSLYPGFVLRMEGIMVEASTGLNEVQQSENWTVTGGNQELTMECTRPARFLVCRPDGSIVFSREVQKGRYCLKLPQGLYIVNSKKVLVK